MIKSKIILLKFQKILKKIIHVHMDVFYMRALFEDDIHYNESYTKKKKSQFETDEQHKHCSLLEMLDFVFFCVALTIMYFIVRLYTHVEHIHMNVYNFFQNFL